MRSDARRKGLGLGLALLLAIHSSPVQAHESSSYYPDEPMGTFATFFGVMELPFLFITVFFAFRTAQVLEGGVFGKGMRLMAWGFLVMSIGHLNMQLVRFTGTNILNDLIGVAAASTIWAGLLIGTWALTGYGLYSIYRAGKAS